MAAVLGLPFTNISGQFVGPLGQLAGGVDISLLLAMAAAGVLYLGLLLLYPEPRDVYGPAGPWLVRSADVPVPAIVPVATGVVG